METQGKARPRVIAFGSGKGGAGKTLCAANTAIFLATLGKRVTLIDASFGTATAHTFVGVPEPERTLSEALGEDAVPLANVVVKSAIPGLDLIAGRLDPPGLAEISEWDTQKLIDGLATLPSDYVLIDVGVGLYRASLDLMLAAGNGVVVVTPDPAGVELGYRLLRTLFLRRLTLAGIQIGMDRREYAAYPGGIPGPLDLWQRAMRDGDTTRANEIHNEMISLKLRLLINQVRSKADLHLGRAMTAASHRVLGLPLRFLGHVEYDDAVWVAQRRGRPLLVEQPDSRVARCFEKITRALLVRESDSQRLTLSTALPENHYQLFDVVPDAADEEIRRAYRRARLDTGRDSILTRGLYTPEGLDEHNQRLEEAYATLMDPVRRKAYDQELFPEGVPTSPTPESSMSRIASLRRAGQELPPMPVIDEGTEFNGRLMREIREARGLDLREIAEQTKIGMAYLDALENESFGKLPAVVYVRGFLTEYARMLDLDVSRVLGSYLPRYLEERQVRHS